MKIKVTKLDKLFSEFIRKRANGKCERCKKPKEWKELQCSHFHGRRKQSVRFDEFNARGICFGCHLHLTANPLEHTLWFEEQIGKKAFKKLNVRAQIPHRPDYKALEFYYKEKLKQLDESRIKNSRYRRIT